MKDKYKKKHKTSKRPKREIFEFTSKTKEAKNVFRPYSQERKTTRFKLKEIKKALRGIINGVSYNQKRRSKKPEIKTYLQKYSANKYLAKTTPVLQNLDDLVRVIVHWDYVKSLIDYAEELQKIGRGETLLDKKRSMGVFATKEDLLGLKHILEEKTLRRNFIGKRGKVTYKKIAEAANLLGGLLVSPGRKIEATEQRVKDIILRHKKWKYDEKATLECVAICTVAQEKSHKPTLFSLLNLEKI